MNKIFTFLLISAFATSPIAAFAQIEAIPAKTQASAKVTDMTVYFREGVSKDVFETALKTLGANRVWSVFPQQSFNAKLTEAEISALRADKNIWFVESTPNITTQMADVVNIIDADLAWQRQVGDAHLDGENETVCVLDTGVDFSHESLTASNILGHNLDCYNGNCTNSVNYGADHGTHVAGIVAGSGTVRGVAPKANIISLKVFNGASSSLDSITPIVNAVNWCKNHADQYNISVINMSFGSIFAGSNTCDDVTGFAPVKQAVDQATNQNISVVASSGNQGSRTSVNFPACLNNAIAVGGTTKSDTLYGSSNYNSLVKLFAPAKNITSALAGGGTISMTGTSMAAPVVAGSIAIINQYYDAINRTGSPRTPAAIEDLLRSTGFVFNPDINAVRININDALGSIIPVSPTSQSSMATTRIATTSCSVLDC